MMLTMSSWCMRMMSTLLTARIRSPTCSFPQRSAGEPSMIRPEAMDFYSCRQWLSEATRSGSVTKLSVLCCCFCSHRCFAPFAPNRRGAYLVSREVLGTMRLLVHTVQEETNRSNLFHHQRSIRQRRESILISSNLIKELHSTRKHRPLSKPINHQKRCE